MPEAGNQEEGGIADRLTRALHHGVAAARCFVALLGAETAAAVNRVARRVVILAGLVFAALLSVVFVLWGAAQMLNEWLGRPGLGQVLVGGAALMLVGLALSLMGDDAGDKDKVHGDDDDGR